MHRTLWIALLSSAGCYQGTGSSPDLEAPYEDDEVVPDDDGDDAPVAVDPVTLPDDGESVATDPGPAVDPAPDGTICAGGGTLDFEVHASALAAAWEGVAVMAAAIENDIMTDPTTSRRPVLVQGSVADGAFSLSCEGSLTENYGYPSWAVVVDLDHDGRCSDGDVGFQMEFYGWNQDVGGEVPVPWTEGTWLPVAELYAPIGERGPGFCDAYFGL